MNNLKKIREKEQVKRAELAANVDVSERYIFLLESGKRTPSLKLASKIAKKLHSSVDEIFLSNKCTKRS